MTAGAKHGLVNAGYRAIDSLSIEKGEYRVMSRYLGCREVIAGFLLFTPLSPFSQHYFLKLCSMTTPAHTWTQVELCPVY
jgi:hypothetical protein